MLKNNKKYLSFIFLVFLSCSSSKEADKILGESVLNAEKPQTFKKIAPLTANSLGSRKNLYEHGWAVIPSAKKGFKSAIESGETSARVARAMVVKRMGKRAKDFPGQFGESLQRVYDWGKESYADGTNRTETIYDMGWTLTKREWEFAKENLSKVDESLVLGYIYLVPRVESDIDSLNEYLASYRKEKAKETSSLNEAFFQTLSNNSNDIAKTWSGSFRSAQENFQKQYEESGNRENSLIALVDIFEGYTVSIKELLFVPVGKTTYKSGELLVVNGVFVPLAHTMNFVESSLVSTGAVLFIAGKSGYRVVSPTLEAGYFGSIGILSAASTVPTYTGMTNWAVFNQVTSATATGVGVTAGTVGQSAYQTGAFATGMLYDLASGTAESTIHAMSAGVVLSYTALTALPPQLILTAVDGPIFITYDGPRVAIAVVRDNYAGYDELPTGSVVDLKEAKKKGKVKILSTDPKLIKKVLDAELKEQTERAEKRANQK